MTAYTLTKNTNLRDLTVAGGYSARTGGDSIANTNGWSFTVDQDTRWGVGAPADALTTSGSLGSITQTAASGGDIIIDGTKVWLIPYNTGSGTLTPSAAGVTISSATGNTIGLYSAMTATPVLTGVAAGWLKITNVSGTLPSSGTFTSDGFTYTITGAPVKGWIEITGDDAGTFTGNRLGKFQVIGDYYEIGTASGTNTTTYNVPNNGKQLWIPSIEVQGATWTITGATWAAGVATFTTSATHDMLVGQPVTITGITPSGFNCVDQYITDLTETTFKVAMADPASAYTSGGTAIAYELYPCVGTLTATAANVYREDTRRGKVFWNTNATTSLALPLGYIRFGHDGTNTTGGFVPPSGRKIRIPNVIFTNCTTAARNQNSIPNATLATRYDFTMTGAGQIYIDKATMNWYLSSTQAQTVQITNSGFMSQITINETPTPIILKNVCIGQEAAVNGVSSIVTAQNPSSTIMHNVVATTFVAGTGTTYAMSISTSSNVQMIDCVGWGFGTRAAATKFNLFNLLINPVQTRLHSINLAIQHTNCQNINVKDTKYSDSTGLRLPTTQVLAPFQPNSALMSGVIDGFSYVGYRAWNQSTIFAPSISIRGPLKIRNFGTYANPLLTGDGPFYDKSWSRTTTVMTFTHVAHGFVVNDALSFYWASATGPALLGVKAVATVPTADTFTVTVTNSGDATGTASYFLVGPAGILPASAAANLENILFQRIYTKFSRGATLAADNSSGLLTLENVVTKFDPPGTTVFSAATLSTVSKYSSPAALAYAATSCYGTMWIEGPLPSPVFDVNTFNWARATTVVTCTTTSGYHNQYLATTINVEVQGSSDEAAFNNGIQALTVPATAGDTANKMRLVGLNTGGVSGTATILPEGGRITIAMNEASSTMQSYTFTAGAPNFTGTGLLRMPTVGDQVVFESPYFIKGHTGFMNDVPVMTTATIANFWIEYDIDTGSGYSGTWKTAFRQTVTAVADGTAGANTIVQVAAGDNWIADGDYVRTTTLGTTNRIAKVSSGGGTTTLTMDKNHNTTFTNSALIAYRHPAENASINYTTGFKFKVRVTTLIAGTGATNTVGSISFRTLTTDASRAITFPLDSNTITFTGLPTGTDVVVLTAGTSTILASVDAGAGTTYAYTYSGAQTIDIGFIKPGYIPQYIRNLALTTTDSSIPVALQIDRNYTA